MLRRVDDWTFDGSLHEFFATQTTLFSVVLVGRLRYRADCDTAIYNRREVVQESKIVTFTVETNLNVVVLYDGVVVLDNPQKLT